MVGWPAIRGLGNPKFGSVSRLSEVLGLVVLGAGRKNYRCASKMPWTVQAGPGRTWIGTPGSKRWSRTGSSFWASQLGTSLLNSIFVPIRGTLLSEDTDLSRIGYFWAFLSTISLRSESNQLTNMLIRGPRDPIWDPIWTNWLWVSSWPNLFAIRPLTDDRFGDPCLNLRLYTHV